ncbi:TPA: hypothetical protein ACGN8S_002237 [Bacillus cereus]
MDNINIADSVQIITSIVGIIISMVAVFISVGSLRATRSSIEEANRPYVVVYREYIQVLSNIHEYVVIKNFGKSGATIDSLIFEPTYLDAMRGKEIFKNAKNTFIAPGQSISTIVSVNPFDGERNDKIKATIKYHTDKKEYQEIITLNEAILHDMVFTKSKPSKSKSIEEIMTKATEEMLRRRL